MRWNRLLPIICLAVVVAGCRIYEAEPLVPLDLLDAIEEGRHQSDGSSGHAGPDDRDGRAPAPLSLEETTRWLLDSGPGLKEALAAYAGERAVAEVKTPLPNPGLTVGAHRGSGLEGEQKDHATQPLAELGFTIPLSGRLGVEDDVHRARADAALVALVVEHRRSYLALRALYSELFAARTKRDLLAQVSASADRSRNLTERLVEAGAASALDLGLIGLDAANLEAGLITAGAALTAVEGDLARLTGKAAALIEGRPLADPPSTPAALPERRALQETLVGNNPDLALLRAAYAVAEQELRLEIRKQYPDLTLGFSFEGEVGETVSVWGLGLGVDVPIFDRNTQAIVRAEGERARVRVAYEAALTRALADLDSACGRLGLARERAALLRDAILPRSEANLDVAIRSVRAGTAEPHMYLEVERAHRLVVVDVLDAEIELRRAHEAIEAVVGVPLGLFPGETEDAYPVLPAPHTDSDDPNRTVPMAVREN